MDAGGYTSSGEQDSLVSELNQGKELARQLIAQMGTETTGQIKGMLAEKIHSSFEKALMILKWGGSMEQCHQHLVPSTIMPGSPISVIGSPKSEDLNAGFTSQQDVRDTPKKRKKMPSWTDQVKATSDSAVEAPPEDGFSWRKYGQKDILGAKYPRSYYRCTYRNLQGCFAIKQVQRNDEDPSLFDLTYKGKHTCTLAPRSKSAPTSPEKKEHCKQQCVSITEYQQQPNMLMTFQTGLNVDIQNLDIQERDFPFSRTGSLYENTTFMPSTTNDNNFGCNFQPSFTPSPAGSTSNYFSTSPCNMNVFGEFHHGQQSESDFTDIFSATTSGTNSPIIGIDYPLDQLEYNPSYPYNSQAFFPSFPQSKE